jgi:uncharacterized protein
VRVVAYKLSKFAHFIGKENIIRHSLNFKLVKVDQKTADYLKMLIKNQSFHIDTQKIEKDILVRLMQEKMIVNELEDNHLVASIIKGFEMPEIQSLFLIVTRKCNLKCTYCFYNNNNSLSLSEKKSMNKNVAKKAIDTFSKLTKSDKATITFYGGEPLLNLPIISSSIKYARKLQGKGKLGEQLQFIVNTNGTLVNKEFIDLAIKEKIEVQISIDGFKETHDCCRITKSGQGSFDKVIRNIEKMSGVGISVVPMITVTENNMNELPKFVEWLCIHTKIKTYSMNLLMSTTGDCKSDYSGRAAGAMWLANDVSSKYGVHDDGFVSQVEGFSGPKICGSGCGATGHKITVFPEGEVHTCQALEKSKIAFMGNLSTIKEDNEIIQIWRKRSRFKNENCLQCPILGACNNGCAAGSFHSYGNIMNNDPNHCQWIKFLFKMWISKTCI